MTATQKFIDTWKFDNVIHTPLQFVLNEIKIISSWQQQTHLLPPVVSLLILLVITYMIARKIFIIKSNLKRKAILLEITPPAFTEKTAYTTEQLFSVIHNSRIGNKFVNWLLGRNSLFSFEIVSSREKGIRYIVRTTPEQKELVKRTVISYLPHSKVQEVSEYMPAEKSNFYTRVIEFKLKNRFAYPLEKQNVLNQHDPVAYITGMMTKLASDELMSFQIVLSPKKTRESHKIAHMILRNEDVLGYLDRPQYPSGISALAFLGRLFTKAISKFCFESIGVINEISHGSPRNPAYAYNYTQMQQMLKATNVKPVRQLSVFEQEVVKSVKEKVDQPLFETSMRALVMVKDKNDLFERINGIKASLEPFAVPQYQSIHAKYNFPPIVIDWIRRKTFEHRLLSFIQNKSDSLLSVSEVSDLYHFPYSNVTQTENIVKVHSKELPAPLSLKQITDFDITFAENTYGGSTTLIGLTQEERARHVYMIGATGTGKTTMLLSMINQDIKNEKGICVIDPHGDLAESIIDCIPEERTHDFIYFNPYDIKHPVGINLLELTPDLDEDDSLIEKEFIAESVISLFRKVFSDSFSSHPHRIEYILRNTIYTAFSVENPTLFTIFDLLNNPQYQKQVVRELQDDDLKNFWKYEFGKAGDYQKVKMVAPVTARIGRFLFSPSARRILEQEKSTVNFDEILDQGKILICNLSKGNIGEDTSEVMGIMLLNKIQLAALKRARREQTKRKSFYLYVDEFQNFATPSFVQMLSEARKYGLNVTIAEQSTSQQKDISTTNIILANAGTVMSFRSANPQDEELLIRQFAPYITSGELSNLPSFHFYIKKAAMSPEEPFSGVTTPVKIKPNKILKNQLIQASQKNYAIEYKAKPKQFKKIKVTGNTEKSTEQKQSYGAYPEG